MKSKPEQGFYYFLLRCPTDLQTPCFNLLNRWKRAKNEILSCMWAGIPVMNT